MNISLLGKNALVGGSSKGIGEAIARQLADSGANVTLMARNEDRMQSIVREMDSSQGQKHQFLVVDFSDFEAFQKTISDFFKSNTVDILVNNTQGPQAGGALEKTVADYQEAFDLLFKSVVFTTELALKHMQDQKWGRIINVASISVKEPLNYLALSNSIRAAVVTWGKSLAYDVAKDGITVNNTLTGYFDTDRIAQLNVKKAEKLGISPDEVRSNMEQQVPVKRIGDPKEYGYLVAFLASEQAAFITGTNIPIDGGLLKSF
ncbi:SDR family oxidoreductase [Flagellimonas zhangzhouensis]|uniref:3-oxoacyl-[acyl-carrier protein] reductase n=1 Tax=Flagellimonas zhangzhouensis TaxID=1073328 RepID=A0A1H2Q4A2_9FLAO|nr:SDR family oxidoreductase [Allomuricauda zhangzhouensis]SDQ48179.1 3-oxoacyl-[acyl-carrier protein] reductase [Allomuricauda zhangzhouensis]SDW01987.1 3-oxoacyl-[acyl-carrier protein] reductase [Allomuricauda zhangzhouensis]